MGKVLEMVREEAGQVFLGVLEHTLNGGEPEDAVVESIAKRAGHHARRHAGTVVRGNRKNGLIRGLAADTATVAAGYAAEELVRRSVNALRGRAA